MSKVNIKVDEVYVREDRTIVLRFKCTKCEKSKTIDDFGVRTMESGEVRRQAQCRKCRSQGAKTKKAKQKL